MSDNSANNKRIAKNTLLLYVRMLLLMGISLYTSRVVLQTLGIHDYGVYNVVGGFVAMFGIFTNSLSKAISRFITVELGKGDFNRLRKVFSTSFKVQLTMSLFIAIISESIGLWFMKNHMQIPEGREFAAQCVFHCSILSFIVSLINVPFNSTIIAHERMSAFAYISIIEASLKLGIVYILFLTVYDKLIIYAILMLLVQISLSSIYWIYCSRQFSETNFSFGLDIALFREIFSFAGWNFIGNTSYLLNTQGTNMLINYFFGVALNAARGVGNQVNGAVSHFVSNFMMALNPQITKSYAVGDKQTAYTLACRGAKFSFFLIFCIALPVILEVDQILHIWLKEPPGYSSSFVVWTLLSTMTTVIGTPLLTLILAHGDVKSYQLNITLLGCLPFPLTWIAFELGYSVITSYVIYFVVYYLIIYLRLILVHKKTGIPYTMYLKEVVLKTHIVSALAVVVPIIIVLIFPPSIERLFCVIFISIMSVVLFSYMIGLTKTEKRRIKQQIIKTVNIRKYL